MAGVRVWVRNGSPLPLPPIRWTSICILAEFVCFVYSFSALCVCVCVLFVVDVSPACLLVIAVGFRSVFLVFLSLAPLSFLSSCSSHAFTYVNRVVEGHGASFNWRLCNYEMPDRNPAACHHKVEKLMVLCKKYLAVHPCVFFRGSASVFCWLFEGSLRSLSEAAPVRAGLYSHTLWVTLCIDPVLAYLGVLSLTAVGRSNDLLNWNGRRRSIPVV